MMYRHFHNPSQPEMSDMDLPDLMAEDEIPEEIFRDEIDIGSEDSWDQEYEDSPEL